MGVVKIVAIRCEGRTEAKKARLGRYNGDLAAGDHLFHSQAAFALPPAVGYQSTVGGDGSKIYDLSVVGQRPDADVASINCRTAAAAEEFINSESRRNEKQYD